MRGRVSSAWPILGLVPLSLLSHLGAALPGGTYYFRDFSVTFFPLRLFQATEIAGGRWPFWNPYAHGGTFVLPMMYPIEWLHALWPSPAAVSWLLTAHFPLAAVGAYLLGLRLGLDVRGSVVAGAVYALGGLAVSSLNLYVFLQALAWAPWVVAALDRVAEEGGRTLGIAAAAVGVAMSTLAMEFVAQAVLLGTCLGLCRRPGPAGLRHVLTSVAVGIGLAAVPLCVTAGLLPETVRGRGFDADVALGNELRPLSLVQVLVPNVFGSLAGPVEAWWGGAFFTKGFPYFLSLYLGPAVLALAACGFGVIERRRQRVLLALSVLCLWYALGRDGGLASLVAGLPGMSWFRFPTKALLIPYLATALLTGAGVQSLALGHRWWRLGWTSGVLLVAGLAFGGWTEAAGGLGWMGGPDADVVRTYVSRDAFEAAGFATVVLIVALAVSRRWARPSYGAAVVATVAVATLARAGAGLNPQVSPVFFEQIPELAQERLDALDGGRVFTYALDESPAFRGFLAHPRPGAGLWSFFLSRQMLAPYGNVVDRIETADSKDLTSFVPYPSEIGPQEYAPGAVDGILDRLRDSSVSRILSLDPLIHPALRLRRTVAAGPPGLSIHVYELAGSSPRAYVACRVVLVPDPAADRRAPLFAADFDPSRDVVLASGSGTCRTGEARRTMESPGEIRYEVVLDGDGYLVVRDSFARGWRAAVDGIPVPVLEANGRHRAVRVPNGRHEVREWYEPPGLRLGIMVAVLSTLGLALLLVGRPRSAAPKAAARAVQ